MVAWIKFEKKWAFQAKQMKSEGDGKRRRNIGDWVKREGSVTGKLLH